MLHCNYISVSLEKQNKNPNLPLLELYLLTIKRSFFVLFLTGQQASHCGGRVARTVFFKPPFTAYWRGYIIQRPGRFTVASSSVTPPSLYHTARSFFQCFSVWKCNSSFFFSLLFPFLALLCYVPMSDMSTSIIDDVFTVLH